MSRIVDADFKQTILKKMGVINDDYHKADLIFKHKVVNI